MDEKYRNGDVVKSITFGKYYGMPAVLEERRSDPLCGSRVPRWRMHLADDPQTVFWLREDRFVPVDREVRHTSP